MGGEKQIHDFEQMTALLVDLAVALARYRGELEVNGFTREEALALCVAYQTALMMGGQRREQD